MAHAKLPKQNRKYSELNKRLAKYIFAIEDIYDALNLEASKIALVTEHEDKETPFRWADYPQTKKRVSDLQRQFVNDIGVVIYRGTSEEWMNSNEAQDMLANAVLKEYGAQVNRKKYKVLYQTNSDALRAFQQRTDKGMNLSDKIWIQSEDYLRSLEDAISCAIEKGMSAVTLSKRVSKYLADFPSMRKEYKERFRKATDAHDCEYRSIRLAASEINMAYRTAENLRWQQMDFVVGYEIKLSGNHNCKGVPNGQFYDICDELAGKYPKDFQWLGWHPLCRCYKIPILKTEEEFWAWDGRIMAGEPLDGKSVNRVEDVPEEFKRWVQDNRGRIARAKSMPYFIRDNSAYVQRVLNSTGQTAIAKVTFEDIGKEWVFNKTTKKQYAKCDMAQQFDFIGFKQDAAAALSQHGLQLDRCSCQVYGEDKFVFVIEGTGFEMKRTFTKRNDGIEVHHDLFTLGPEYQGNGLSKEMFRALYKRYQQMGVRYITVQANIDVGGYTWARYGFKALDKDEAIFGVEMSEKATTETIRKAQDFIRGWYKKNNLLADTPFPMRLLSEQPYGKEVLLGSNWNGIIDLTDKAQVQLFERYLGLRR